VRPPSRQFHLPSALRPSSVRIDGGSARRLVSEGALLVDVRRHDDPGAHLAGSVRIPPDLIPTHLPGFRREVAIVLACT
jgi:rhodanese-related sulfurtransferase